METTNNKKRIISHCRYYGLFAISKTDPTLILGYVENSFSMGWSKYFVNLWPAYKKKALLRMAKREASSTDKWSDEKFLEFCESHYNVKYGKEDAFYKDGMSVEEARKAYVNLWFGIKTKCYGTQGAWNELSDRGIYVPDGFYTKVFRLGSTKLPVTVDLRYRDGLVQGEKLKWDKWYYRNAHFWVKELNPGKTLENTDGLPFELSKEQYNGSCTYEYGVNCPHKNRKKEDYHKEAHVLSRHEFKKLKHQKECKSIAEKGSPRGVGAST